MCHFHKYQYVFKRQNLYNSIIIVLYVIIVSAIYSTFCQSSIARLLIPAKRPHDQKFLSGRHHQVPTISPTRNSRDIILVTASSAHFVDRLENLIGSIHFYEPYLPIVIFDLGMTDAQLSRIACMANVKIELLPFEFYPNHVADLDTFAYKALLLKESLEKFRSETKAIFYLDAGAELRSSLDPIITAIETKGYFLTRQKTLIIDYTDEHTFTALNMSKSDFSTGNHYQTAAGFIGFSTRASNFYENILIPFVACSLDKNCIAPESARSSSKHRFDQSVLSLLVHKNAYQIENDERFYGDFGSEDKLDETMVIFSRRWHCPKVYTSAIVFQRTCNYSLIFRPRYRMRNVHEHTNVYTCGKLTVIKYGSHMIELPVYHVYWLLYFVYMLLMITLYCCATHVSSRLFPAARRKQRIL